jgi:histidinol dehydrogenase
VKISRLSTADADFDSQLSGLLAWDMSGDAEVDRLVRAVIDDVRARGDSALLEYTTRFDRLAVATVVELELSRAALKQAWQQISDVQRKTLTQARDRIRAYHEQQLDRSWSFTDDLGNELGQRITPLERVGVYVPGGQASYPSSVLMTLVPAKVAGVDELVVTVPAPDGIKNEMVLAALYLAEPDRVFTIGGAQAIAALAFGTQSVPKVDKIVGPGGSFVAAAKRMVFGQVGIDIIAGPSEVLIVADGTTDPEWTALDLFSQAEHDAAAQSLLLSPDQAFIDAVAAHMVRLLPQMQRKDIIAASLAARGGLIFTRSLDEAIDVANRVAPEHLELHVADPDRWLSKVRHAGAIFCGAHASETLGDYVAGPSHVLPTFGTARFASPLGVYDFQKRSSIIKISPEGAAALADIAVPLATSEGLHAHARSAAVRATDKNNK